MVSTCDDLETADIETASEDYAGRFSGAVGAWFLKVQEDATLKMLSPYPGAAVLDVGGGHGQLTEALVRNGYRVTVLGSTEACKRRIETFVAEGRCTFNAGDILSLPYSDREFEVAISYRLLPHVKRWSRLVTELARVARKTVVVDYPSVRSLNRMAPSFFRLKKRLEGNTRPFACFRETELLEVFRGAGFVRAERYPEFFLPMLLHRILRWPAFSSGVETMFRLLGATGSFGSPVILKMIRQDNRLQ